MHQVTKEVKKKHKLNLYWRKSRDNTSNPLNLTTAGRQQMEDVWSFMNYYSITVTNETNIMQN